MPAWNVGNIVSDNNQLKAVIETVDSSAYLKSLQPAGQVLVDSDAFTFVYILEDEQEKFAHLRFPDNVWADLNKARLNKRAITAVFSSGSDNISIELAGFWEELDFLLENIRGNSNYGDEMVSRVEKSFTLR
ncbi:hypothetical protein SAMN05421736_10542 [Evansella caseinilytica]|uniref:Uncharacterized protein n=1 Tax=Evansella caseinilytica TaxID=1503961 RepID=A0A1H3PIH9_9BACI|nr:hypothetical protein [Evansella caseinilytica]SDZ00199.1 hypothetical protein SAMN05421736_10542 [Evansella caseinilytica]